MAVIGRLDEQVDAVLISPLARKRRPEPPPEGAAADGQSAPDARQPPSQTSTDSDAADVARGAARETLPVWLL